MRGGEAGVVVLDGGVDVIEDYGFLVALWDLWLFVRFGDC